MEVFLIVLAVIIGFGFYVFTRGAKSKKAVPKKSESPPEKTWPYASVSIMTPRVCCEAANELIGKKFLLREAPKIPLARCTSATCKCGYIKHIDRRDEEEDRRALAGLRSQLHVLESGAERRLRKGRRATDSGLG